MRSSIDGKVRTFFYLEMLDHTISIMSDSISLLPSYAQEEERKTFGWFGCWGNWTQEDVLFITQWPLGPVMTTYINVKREYNGQGNELKPYIENLHKEQVSKFCFLIRKLSQELKKWLI